MNSAAALDKFKSIYQSVSDQLQYAQQIVGFMDFDPEHLGPNTKADEQNPEMRTFEDVAKELTDKIGRNVETMSSVRQFNQGEGGPTLAREKSPLRDSRKSNKSHLNIPADGTPKVNLVPPRTGSGSRKMSIIGQQSSFIKFNSVVVSHGSGHLSLEECLHSFPRELMQVMLGILCHAFTDANLPLPDTFSSLMQMLYSGTQRNVINDIEDRFFQVSKLQFQQ